MKITPLSFFSKYIVDPFSEDIQPTQKLLALALSILFAPMTLGIAHFTAYIVHKKDGSNSLARFAAGNHTRFAAILEKLKKVSEEALKLKGNAGKELPLNQAGIPFFIQNAMIQPYYSQKLPSRKNVEVPFRDGKSWDKTKWVKWCSLSRRERVEVNNHFGLPHNRVRNDIFGQLFIDLIFFGSGVLGTYLKNDPRRTHGSDHCVRVALYSASFAYLYHKYHPNHIVASNDVISSQMIGAGHDAGRQTEGTDVYDSLSAEITIQALKKLGIDDPDVLMDAKAAIEEKDSKNLKNKCLIAKCVHDADSADFYRIQMNGAAQSKASFNRSRKFLDIFNDLNELSNGDPNYVLKNNFTYGDFLEELDALRKEMNLLTYSTHRKRAREEFSRPGKNYFDSLSERIQGELYPLLTHALQQVGVLIPSESANKLPT